ncbi:MAG: T9SS type A sorting domain-containing protein [Nonlabens sp.]|nr:T9SS type A sorting domain-containing protein [Nonlabens sp.]
MIHKAVLFIFLGFVSAQAQFWTESSSGFPTTSTGASKFHVLDANVAWATGYDGIVPNNNIQQYTTTSNAGATWNAGPINLGNTNLGISNISAVSATTAYVAAYPRLASNRGGVWITTDTGLTWTKQTTASFSNANSFTNIVHYFNVNDGVAIGDPINGSWEIYITGNGGTVYAAVAASSIPAPLNGEVGYIAQFDAIGDSIWFSTSSGRIYHSANKGMNWNVYQSPLNDLGGANLSGDYSFTNATQGILQDNSGNLWRTFDSGATWSLVTIAGTGNPYGDAIAYLPGTSQLISTGSQTNFSGSSYSLDNGTTWINIDTVQHVDIAIFDENTAYSGGFSSTSAATGVFKYTGAVLSTPSIEEDYDFTIYPNPVEDILNFTTSLEVTQFNIRAMNGSIIKQVRDNTSIPVSNLAAGVYLLEINTAGTSFTLPFIKN